MNAISNFNGITVGIRILISNNDVEVREVYLQTFSNDNIFQIFTVSDSVNACCTKPEAWHQWLRQGERCRQCGIIVALVGFTAPFTLARTSAYKYTAVDAAVMRIVLRRIGCFTGLLYSVKQCEYAASVRIRSWLRLNLYFLRSERSLAL